MTGERSHAPSDGPDTERPRANGGGDEHERTDGTDTERARGVSDGGQFESIDWDDLDDVSRSLPPQTLAFLGVVALYALGLLWEFALKPENAATIPQLGWQIDPVDWLYVATLIVLVFYIVVPLYREREITRYYWRQFRKNRAAVVSLVYLVVIFAIGTVGPAFIEPPQVAPRLQYQPPVFASVDAAVPIQCVGEVANGRCHGTWDHPLGTTHQGKDILVMVIYGMLVSMQVGLTATLIVVVVASLVGISAAYFGGTVDEALMRYVDIQITFPTFFLYLLAMYLFGGSLLLMILIFGLLGWGGVARIVRSEALQRREEEFVLAARAAGARGTWTMRKHLLPNVSNSIITAASLLIPGFILFEAALAFLALGDPTIPSWGQVIAAGRDDLARAWWVSTIPGVFLFFTILAFNFLGDALRDALDPRQEVRL
jgi:peptide/nickel transport system permease protein